MNFDQAFERVLGHEGGFVHHPSDPGGATKFGISQRAYPGEDIEGMTIERAKELYRRDYWGPSGCDALPPAIRLHVFDAAVNSGPRAAARWLQRVVGETEDGIVGPRTIQAASSIPAGRLIARFTAIRLEMLTTLPTWPAFGKGWVRRVAANLKDA